MTVVQNSKGIYCLSSDTKPAGTDFYTKLIETDTLKEFMWDGLGSWVTISPTAHATSHKTGGADAIKLDELAATTDVTTLNASTTAHGLLPKLSNSANQFLTGLGTYTAIPDAALTANVVMLTGAQTLASKTLTTPIIASASGSSLTYSDIGSGIFSVINNTATSFSAVYITGSHTTIADATLRAFFRLRSANSANTEYLEFTAQGTAGFTIGPSKDGSGSYRDFLLKNAGLTMITYKADGIEMAINDAKNISVGTTTGTKIGTGATQKLGFFNATPIVQPAANPDTSSGVVATVETEVNELKATLRALGLLAP